MTVGLILMLFSFSVIDFTASKRVFFEANNQKLSQKYLALFFAPLPLCGGQ
jgi:hypothetical protein